MDGSRGYSSSGRMEERSLKEKNRLFREGGTKRELVSKAVGDCSKKHWVPYCQYHFQFSTNTLWLIDKIFTFTKA
ncbi:hypothetical protein CULT_1670015 [[Clostridium] ultunense Esp]|nr:hypothetical protein CULT_1670015 [[Clostridium] ultunense Esp]